MRPTVRGSTTSTSSAQVDGQSCGQAEAPMRIGEECWRTISFIAPPRQEATIRSPAARLLESLLGDDLFPHRSQPGATPIAADDEDQNRSDQGAEQRDVV